MDWGLVNNFFRDHRATFTNPLNDDLLLRLQRSRRDGRERCWRLHLGRKLITLAGHGNDVWLIALLRPQRLPETKDMLSKIALFDKGIGPYRLQQFFFGNDASGVGHKIQKHFEGLRFERGRCATVGNRARADIQLVLSEPVEVVEAGHIGSSLNCVLQHLNKDSQVVNGDFENGGDVCVPSWY